MYLVRTLVTAFLALLLSLRPVAGTPSVLSPSHACTGNSQRAVLLTEIMQLKVNAAQGTMQVCRLAAFDEVHR